MGKCFQKLAERNSRNHCMSNVICLTCRRIRREFLRAYSDCKIGFSPISLKPVARASTRQQNNIVVSVKSSQPLKFGKSTTMTTQILRKQSESSSHRLNQSQCHSQVFKSIKILALFAEGL